MLEKLGERVAVAFERAEACDQRARDATNPEFRSDYQCLAQNWRLVTRSHRLVESLKQFLIDSQMQRDLPAPEPPERE